MRVRIGLVLAICLGAPVSPSADSLTVREIDPAPGTRILIDERTDQLPHSRVVRGKRDISLAWLAGPTDRYNHGVLGDELEASQLVVEMSDGGVLVFELPPSRVYEDLLPRLVDLDGDGRDEVLVVESDMDLGASLSVYGIIRGRLARRAITPFLGRPHRWLNPVGTGDFNADGRLDVAIVATPHIGGILRLYHFNEPTLLQYEEIAGVSTHQIGSTELGLGQVVPLDDHGDGLLLPDQSRHALILFQWTPNGISEIARAQLPGAIASSLVADGANRWRFKLEDGRGMELRLE